MTMCRQKYLVICFILTFCLTCRYKDEEEQSGYSALDHIRHFSEMRKLEESELSDGDEDDGSFGSPSLTEAVKQPLFRKSKSQVKNTSIHMHAHLFTYTAYMHVCDLSMVVKCNSSPSPSGVCHDAVSG